MAVSVYFKRAPSTYGLSFYVRQLMKQANTVVIHKWDEKKGYLYIMV